MNTFAIVFLCIQAGLVQNAYSQCGSYGAEVIHNSGLAPGLTPGLAPGFASFGPTPPLSNSANLGSRYFSNAGVAAANVASFGGSGDGNVAVAGELPVVGNTGIIGQVPILGAVSFGGSLPAAGTVIITGQCSCGCGY